MSSAKNFARHFTECEYVIVPDKAHFSTKSIDSLLITPWKHMLWVPIRSTSTVVLLMSTQNAESYKSIVGLPKTG